jgi:hypothetical protein
MTYEKHEKYALMIVRAIEHRNCTKKDQVVQAMCGPNFTHDEHTFWFNQFNWARRYLTLQRHGCFIPHASGGPNSQLWVFRLPVTIDKIMMLAGGSIMALRLIVNLLGNVTRQLEMVIEDENSNKNHAVKLARIHVKLEGVQEMARNALKAIEEMKLAAF